MQVNDSTLGNIGLPPLSDDVFASTGLLLLRGDAASLAFWGPGLQKAVSPAQQTSAPHVTSTPNVHSAKALGQGLLEVLHAGGANKGITSERITSQNSHLQLHKLLKLELEESLM